MKMNEEVIILYLNKSSDLIVIHAQSHEQASTSREYSQYTKNESSKKIILPLFLELSRSSIRLKYSDITAKNLFLKSFVASTSYLVWSF